MKLFYKIAFWFSVTTTLAAVVILGIYGLRLGIDFKGGALMEVVFSEPLPADANIESLVERIDEITDIQVTPTGDKGYILRLNAISEATRVDVLNQLSSLGSVKELSFDSVGPVIGQELRTKSITAIIVLIIVVALYITFVFRSLSRVLSVWSMSLATILALLHDVLITLGIFSLLGAYRSVDITIVFVAAVLTILGYSISDTVVVFDRVRENVIRLGSKVPFSELVHTSIKQTLVRSLNTSMTTILTMFAIYFFGGESTRYFSLALIIGISLGAYSSFFVASPVLMWWHARFSSVPKKN